MSAATTYGFIGLGHQGTPMAERMIDGGLRPWLWARRAQVLDRYRDCEATDSVLFGADGIMTSIRPGTILSVHATLGPQYVVDLAARIADRGAHLVDAPVSGGDEAATGNLLVMVGGHDEHIAACLPMFTTYANRVVNVGGLGAAQAVKLINNALMTAITGLVFDSFDLGAQFGVDADRLGEVLAGGSASNPSVGYYLGLGGAEELSIRAWPTLHKDVELVATVTDGTPFAQGLLVSAAVATIAEMAERRAGWVSARERESDPAPG